MRLLVLASSLTDVRPGLIFWTLVTFIALFFVLRSRAWKPILDLVAAREKQIIDSMEAAKLERLEAEKKLGEAKESLDKARREAAELAHQAQLQMEKFKEQLMADAHKKAEEEMLNARRMINEEKLKAIAEVKGMAVDLALSAAEQLINEKMDDARHRKLAEQFIDGLPRGPVRPA